MKRFVIYTFLCIYLFSFSEVRQVLKFPNFVEHYLTHKINNLNTSVFSFVKMHYLDDHPEDADYQQDMKLPFKTHETNTFVSNPLTLPEYFRFGKDSEVFRKKSTHFFLQS